ncbi:ABC transporter ATP-binding protein [Oscillospiraceae bacterium LCP25S3_E10]|nr:ABC transporter ATP-binding protein/permease [Ruminococcus sp.]MDD6447697.1 ABC transporter ATP-binding protein [Ruminococcus sp.]
MVFKLIKEKSQKLISLKDELMWLFSLSKCYKKEIFAVTVLSVIGTVFSLTTSLCLKYVIDIVTGALNQSILLVALAAVAMLLGSILLSAITSRITTKVNVKIQNELQLQVYGTIFNAQWESLREYRKGDLINRINSDVSLIASGAVSWWPTVITFAAKFIYTFVLIVMNDPIMAAIALMSAPVSALLSRFMIRKMHNHNLKVKELSADIMSYQEDSFQNLQYIKSFGISDVINKRLIKKQQEYKEESLNYNKTTVLMNIIMGLVGITVTFVSYAWGIYRLWEGFITYGTMVMFLQLTLTLSNSFNSILSVIPTTINLGTSAARIISLENLPEEKSTPTAEEKKFINNNFKSGVSINCSSLTFSYSDEPNEKVLNNASFSAGIGETIAIIGGSGIGKTTFFRLLLGLLEPTEGEITFKGINGEIIKAGPSTRELIAYVPQGNTIISGTVAENLRLIKKDATDEEIIIALKLSCAYDFVSKLPQGINSQIGESGKGFSEGQIQRITIARALIKDAPILLFDEVTSALDEETESRLLHNIQTHFKNKTIIFVTHKLNALDISDKVYKIDKKQLHRVNYSVVENK